MPSLSIESMGDGNYRFIISLSNPFNTAYYSSAGLSWSEVSSGSSSVNYCAIQYALNSTTAYYVEIYRSAIEGELYYAWAQSANGLYYPAGSAVVPANTGGSSGGAGGGGSGTTELAQEFNWTYAYAENGNPVPGSRKVSGKGFYLAASEWNALMDTIQTVYNRRTGGGCILYYANSGDKILATSYNDVWKYLGKMMGSVETYYSEYFVSSGDPVRADCLNLMVDIINQLRIW